MPSLLDLPREIRDDILLLIITSSRPLPDTTTYDRNDPEHGRCELRGSHWSRQGVFYEPSYPSVNATPLLLTNRQLHKETIDAVHRFGLTKINADGWFFGKSTSLSYLIDVVLVQEHCLWPTWLSIPVLSTHVHTVRACIRIEKSWKIWDDPKASDENGQRRRPYRPRPAPMFREGDGGPPGIVWTFYSLLEQFLERGPFGGLTEATKKRFDRRITVDVLELEFLSSSEEADYQLGLDPDNTRGGMRYSQSKIMRAEYLMNYLRIFMGVLLNISYHSANYGAILYEQIGKIRFLLDGKICQESDLAQRLVKMNNKNAFSSIEREKRPEYFQKWKRETLKLRRENGLPVIFPEDWVESDDDHSEAAEA